MKVYLINRTYGQWEIDSFGVTIGFTDKNEAEEYIQKLNTKIERVKALAREIMPKDEDGELDWEHPNWHRFNQIFSVNPAFISEVWVK